MANDSPTKARDVASKMPDTQWRRMGWQLMELTVPADWFLSKISTERLTGELWLADNEMPRVQIKWFDTSRSKSVQTEVTLKQYLESLEKRARKSRLDWEEHRDIKLVGRAGRDLGSMECFHWAADIEAYGVIWYSREGQRVTLAQVNGARDEPRLKVLAKQVLNSLRDAPAGEDALWTAYDLECRIPLEYQLKGQIMETGHTELTFEHRVDSITVMRYGLASIALEREGDLGDWAFRQRFKPWLPYALEREAGEQAGYPAVTFRGRKRGPLERLRTAASGFMRRAYPSLLAARVWHCQEANCLYIVETVRDIRSQDRLDTICASIPCQPRPVGPPKA